MVSRRDTDVADRTLWLCRMPYGGSRMLAAAFCSIGCDTRVTPDEDARTLELGGKYTSGDECYPAAHRARRLPEADRGREARPQEDGLSPPHRQWALPLRAVRGSAPQGARRPGIRRRRSVLSITSADGYAGIGEQAGELIRTAWRSVVVQDILMKLLLMTRPYEIEPGQTDKVYLESLDLMGDVIGPPGDRQQGADGRPQGRSRSA